MLLLRKLEAFIEWLIELLEGDTATATSGLTKTIKKLDRVEKRKAAKAEGAAIASGRLKAVAKNADTEAKRAAAVKKNISTILEG